MKEQFHTLRLSGPSGSDSDEDDMQSPRWSLAPFGWKRRQQRRPGLGAATAAAAAKARLPHCVCSALLAAAVLAVLAWAGLRLAHGRQLHLEMWQEEAKGAGLHGSGSGGSSRGAQCQLPLDGSPWERHCQRLDRVCVDQGTLILYGDRYQQLDGRKAGRLPELLIDTSKIFEYPWRKTSSEAAAEEGGARRRLQYDVLPPGKNRRLPPLPMRPATSEEPTPYLQTPCFSTCTVPVLLYSSWRANFFHIFKDMAAQVYSLLRRTPWRHHSKLVMVTPDGLPLTMPEAALLPPLSRLSVQSMADFSRRLPPGLRLGQQLDATQPPASYEGGEQRCFQTAFFCGRNFPAAAGLPAAEEAGLGEEEVQQRLAAGIPVEPYSYGQALAAYMQQKQQRRRHAPPDVISLQQAAAAAGGATERAATSGRLRVALMRRGGEGRQILNAGELLERCNAWRYRPPGSTKPVTAECHEISVPDLESGVAAAREADVFIGIHGANLANGWMMRPGASVIEITPYQFEYGRGSFVFSVMNSKDATSQVLWWVAVLCDPAASTPGPSEQARQPPEDWWPRDRNVRLPWAAVEEVLQEVVAVGGSQQRYMEQYFDTWRHRFNFDAAGVISRGGSCPNGTRPQPGR